MFWEYDYVDHRVAGLNLYFCDVETSWPSTLDGMQDASVAHCRAMSNVECKSFVANRFSWKVELTVVGRLVCAVAVNPKIAVPDSSCCTDGAALCNQYNLPMKIACDKLFSVLQKDMVAPER